MLLRSLTTSLFRRTSSITTATAATRILQPHPMMPFALCFSTTTGVVKWFDAKKGFGFVVPDDGSSDCFVHHSEIHKTGFRSLGEGEAVEFEIEEEGSGRRRAMRVTGPDGVEVQGGARRLDSEYGSRYGMGGGGGFGGGGGMGGGFGGGKPTNEYSSMEDELDGDEIQVNPEDKGRY